MKKANLIAVSAAALFALGTMATVANAQSSVKCSGINSCKGTSACKTGSSACKGMNSCKGQGWTEAANAGDCTAKGGKIL